MKRRVLFLDRDGTLIYEPPETRQVDTLEQLVLEPYVITSLQRILQAIPFEVVMVTNQDGLGTAQYPVENFERVQSKLLSILAGEGVFFHAVYVDRSLPHEQRPTRKPGVEMVRKYFSPEYDLKNSVVIGDRLSDMIFARNLGAQGIWYHRNIPVEVRMQEVRNHNLESTVALITTSWLHIAEFLVFSHRWFEGERKTRETHVRIRLNIDGTGYAHIRTGIRFLDHMLELMTFHAGWDLLLSAEGDLDVDDHHTVEDVAILLGQAVHSALSPPVGISRYGFVLPMDEAYAQIQVDWSGRAFLVWNVPAFRRSRIGDMASEMVPHFFRSLVHAMQCTLHVFAQGENEHHIVEAIFKGVGRAFRQAFHRCIWEAEKLQSIPSTKGIL